MTAERQWLGVLDSVTNFFWYLLENIVYRSYFLLAMICICYFLSFTQKIQLFVPPQDRDSGCEK